MDPLTIAASLAARFAPDILHLFGADKAADVAARVVGIAQQVTGTSTGEAAMVSINADPNFALQFQKAVLDQKVALEQIAAQRAKDEAEADNKGDELLTQRMAILEGTAADLKGIPYLGAAMLFLRGSQRIVISYGTALADWLWLSGGLGVLSDMQQRLLFSASLLVFVVLFGERAVKNVAPLVIELLGARREK